MEHRDPSAGEQALLPSISIAVDWLTFCFAGQPSQALPPGALGCPTPGERLQSFAALQNEVGWPVPGNVDGLYHLSEPGLAYAVIVAGRRLARPVDLPLGEW